MLEKRMLSKEIIELQTAMMDLPPAWRRHLLPSLDRLVEVTARRRRILCLVQEALEKINMDVKYLMFDLHCTKQERDALK